MPFWRGCTSCDFFNEYSEDNSTHDLEISDDSQVLCVGGASTGFFIASAVLIVVWYVMMVVSAIAHVNNPRCRLLRRRSPAVPLHQLPMAWQPCFDTQTKRRSCAWRPRGHPTQPIVLS